MLNKFIKDHDNRFDKRVQNALQKANERAEVISDSNFMVTSTICLG